jgi:AsmA protein
MRVLKTVGVLLIGFVVLLALLLSVLILVIDPNDYKDEIGAAVEDASGYQLTLRGDLSWSFYPVLGFESEDVVLSAGTSKPALMQLQKLSLGVQLIPLFSQQLQVELLQLEGLQAHLLVDEQGRSNWQPEPSSAADKTDNGAADQPDNNAGPSAIPEFRIPQVRILNALIRYTDQSADAGYALSIQTLEFNDVQLGQPFGMNLKASLQQAEDKAVLLEASAQMSIGLEFQHYSIEQLDLAARLSGYLPQPTDIRLLAGLALDRRADRAQLSLQNMTVLGVEASATVTLNALSSNLSYHGDLAIPTFDPQSVLSLLQIEPPDFSSQEALSSASVKASFSGDLNQLKVSQLSLLFDASSLTGQLAVTQFEPQVLQFDLALDQVNADHYLSKPSDQPVTTSAGQPPAQPESETLFPIELLRALEIDGRLTVQQLIYQQIPMQDILLVLEAHGGVVTITTLQATLLRGSVDGRLAIDARKSQPVLNTKLTLSDIDLSQLASGFTEEQLLAGRASFDMNMTAQGNDTDTLLKAALGQLNLQMSDGVIHGVNLNDIVVSALREQLGNFEALFPQYEKYLPKELKKDTEVTKLLANAKIENGKLIMPQFEFATDSSAVNANGSIDLLQQAFDYNFAIQLSSTDRNKYLKGTQWPVHCAGSLDQPAQDWCRPDSKKMSTILRKAAGAALKDKSAKEIGEKIGLDSENQDQLEDELKNKLKEEEDRAKRKLQQKLDKWLKR